MAAPSDEPDNPAGNPYAAPGIEPVVVERERIGTDSRSGGAAILWAVLFWLNTPLCLMLSWDDAGNAARLGILIVCVGYLIAGVRLVYSNCRVRAPLLVGAVLVGLAQFAVFLHLYVGLFAFAICNALGVVNTVASPKPYSSLLSGMLMTLFTGGLLLLISALVGWPMLAIWRWLGERPVRHSA